MDYSLITKLRLKELGRQWKFTVIFIISLIISLAFLVLFASKLLSITDSFHRADLKVTENILYASQSPIKESLWQAENSQESMTQIQKGRLIVNIADKDSTVQVVGMSPEVQNYFNDLLIPDTFNDLSHKVLLPEDYLNKYNLAIGDEILISNTSFKIIGSHEAYYFKDSFIIPLNTILTPNNTYEEILILNQNQFQESELLQSIQDKGYQINPFSQLESNEKQSLFNFLIFVTMMSGLFSLIAFINCLLSFEGRRRYLQRTSSIHRLAGSTVRQQSIILFVENLVLGLIGLNFSLIILMTSRDWIPQYFRVNFSLSLLIISHLLMFLLICIFSLFAYLKMYTHNLIIDFKEVS